MKPSRTRPSLRSLLGCIACALVGAVVFGCSSGPGGAPTGPSGTSSSSSSSSSGSGCTYSDETFVDDPLGDFVDSESKNMATMTCPCMDIVRVGVNRGKCTPAQAEVDFNGYGRPQACEGQDVNPGSYHVCLTNYLGIHAAVAHVETTFAGPVELADPSRSFVYSVVVASDQNPKNDWVPHPPFDWDLYQGADRWYQLEWDHLKASWSLHVTQVDDQQQQHDVPMSSARAIISADTIDWYFDGDEVPDGYGRYRVTSFVHDGKFSASARGADVNGKNPTEPLTPLH